MPRAHPPQNLKTLLNQLLRFGIRFHLLHYIKGVGAINIAIPLKIELQKRDLQSSPP